MQFFIFGSFTKGAFTMRCIFSVFSQTEKILVVFGFGSVPYWASSYSLRLLLLLTIILCKSPVSPSSSKIVNLRCSEYLKKIVVVVYALTN